MNASIFARTHILKTLMPARACTQTRRAHASMHAHIREINVYTSFDLCFSYIE